MSDDKKHAFRLPEDWILKDDIIAQMRALQPNIGKMKLKLDQFERDATAHARVYSADMMMVIALCRELIDIVDDNKQQEKETP